MQMKGRSAWLIAVLASGAFLIAACGSSSPKASDSTTTAPPTTAATSGADLKGLSGTLTGGGSSFQDAFQQKSIADFTTALKSAGSSATVVYQKSGSGQGKQQLAAGTLDFAGSDSTISDKDTELYPKASSVLYFPTVAAPITMSYNLPDVKVLKLDADTIAKIAQAQITTWNDPAIAATNSGVTLPSTKITFVHRSDASGTTSNFTKYLAAAAPTTFKLTPGQTVAWPSSTQGAATNSGVATAIGQTAGAIGYVDLSDAAKAQLQVAQVKNSTGAFIKPDLPGAAAAVASATINADLTYNPLNAPGADAYPITSPTWMLVFKKQTSATTAALLKAYLNFVLTTEQAQANSVLYTPLPPDLAKKAIAQIDMITS